jgi:hypothetical protein
MLAAIYLPLLALSLLLLGSGVFLAGAAMAAQTWWSRPKAKRRIFP